MRNKDPIINYVSGMIQQTQKDGLSSDLVKTYDKDCGYNKEEEKVMGMLVDQNNAAKGTSIKKSTTENWWDKLAHWNFNQRLIHIITHPLIIVLLIQIIVMYMYFGYICL